MDKYLFILGRQPGLGLAELESLLGTDRLTPCGVQAAVVSGALPDNFFNRLGGSLKQAHIIAELDGAAWPQAERFAKSKLGKLLTPPASGKLQLGLSFYGLRATPAQVSALGLSLKKQLRSPDRPVRLVMPVGQTHLSTAQILGNKLDGRQGLEVVFYSQAGRLVVAVTDHEQDINSYTKRDYERPKRDAKVGMLPPKLAQIMINLSTGPVTTGTILDPFCGTGVVLQEAALMGYTAHGTDLEPRMIDYSQINLDALGLTAKLEVGDATAHTWQPQANFVASEVYLGQPLSSFPAGEKLQDLVHGCNTIIRKSLRNLHGQLPAGAGLCLALPAWRAPNGRLIHLPLLDRLEEIGYNRISFKHVRTEDLVYFRENQIVARELLVLKRT